MHSYMPVVIFLATLLCLEVVADSVPWLQYKGDNFHNPFPLTYDDSTYAWTEVAKKGQKTSGYQPSVTFFQISGGNGRANKLHTTTLSNKGGPDGKPLSIHLLGGREDGESLRFWLGSNATCTMVTPIFPRASSHGSPVYAERASAVNVYVGPNGDS
jgi:hypothetical protein